MDDRVGAESNGRIWTLRDMMANERVQPEEARALLRLLSAHTTGIVFELNSEMRFVQVWASDRALLARPASELFGRTLVEVLGPEFGAMHEARVRHVLETGSGEQYEYDMDVPSGHRRFAASSACAEGPDGKRSAIFWIRDITEQVELRMKLLQAERLASAGLLAAGVAHEINNPLAYVVLNVDRLRAAIARQGSGTEDISENIEMIAEGAERVRKIVADLLSFARVDANVEPVDPHRALGFSIDVTKPEWETRARMVKEFGEVPLVLVNESRLVQVFINLITNAAQAIPPGNVDGNEIRLVTRTDDQGRAVVEVHDSGMGIRPAVRHRIFDPFFTTKETGTGLGLPMCHGIVKSCGGDITVDSREGCGSTFRVTLPPHAVSKPEIRRSRAPA